jgi:predicted TIM-barrel fold metal-dependent hydrolase
MKKVFESHCHYHLFDSTVKMDESLLKKEFPITGTKKVCFLSIPQQFSYDGKKKFDPIHNLRGMYLKKAFAPNAYSLAGLVLPETQLSQEEITEDYLNQVKKYYEMGFDGMKMLEGYPTFIKYAGISLDSSIYDKFYKFCETNNFPIIMHIANPDENWDIKTASKEAIAQGRVYDNTFPTKEEITNQMFNVLKKFPNLTLTLAHMGFFSNHYSDAIKFMSYPNTRLDVTPGGEQLINMSRHWDLWSNFFETYQDRILYGSDYYPFEEGNYWLVAVNRRPSFLREFFETDSEHLYLNETFKGVKIKKSILHKIYWKNPLNLYKKPRKINNNLVLKEIEKIKDNIEEKYLVDINEILKLFN